MESFNSKTRLSFCVKILKILTLWPNIEASNKKIIQHSWLIISQLPSTIPVAADLVMHFIEDKYNLVEILDNFIALSCILGMNYMTICFIINRKLIRKLIASIDHFKRYGAYNTLAETEKKSNFYSKLFIFYGITGNLVYLSMPISNTKICEENRAKSIEDDGVPCGLIARCRLPFHFNYSPLFEIVVLHQFYTCTTVTLVVLVLTMLLCGFLMYIIDRLNHLQQLIGQLEESRRAISKENLRFCIKYHISIISFSDNVNEAFSGMMVFHLTITSIVISALGFQILIAATLNDALRFSFHLLGWMVLLLLVCYYGQRLIDESISVANGIYSISWFHASACLQNDIKMILMRSQKSLTLRAANIGIISLPTFLATISSAYSYFTLLWKVKS